MNEGVGYWFQCKITWVSPTKKTFGLIFKDHQFTYNVEYTVYKKGRVREGVAEENISTTFHPFNPDLP